MDHLPLYMTEGKGQMSSLHTTCAEGANQMAPFILIAFHVCQLYLNGIPSVKSYLQVIFV